MNHLSFSASPRPTQSSRFQLHAFALMGAIVGLSGSALSAQTLSTGANAAPVPSAAKSAALAAEYGKLPLSFEANHGQTDSNVKFLSRGNGYALFLTDKAAVLELSKSDQPRAGKSKSAARAGSADAAKEPAKSRKTDVIRMELAGASQSAQVTGAEQLPGTANYFVGNDASKWHTSVPTYAKVKYAGVYPGVDLVYYGNQSQLEYDFVVAPKADPKAVQLHFAGAEKLRLAANGDLIVAAKDGEIAFHKPVVYQAVDGQRQPVEGSFALLARNTVGFTLGSYDRSRELVIDPTLAYSTYLANYTSANGVAVDSGGNAYITGSALGILYPLTSGDLNEATDTNSAVLVAKFNPSGSGLVYSALIDGYGGDAGESIAVDAAGSAYVTGGTADSNFPVTAGVIQKTLLGVGDAFVLKLNPAGTALVYSTYLGGSSQEVGASIAVDASGNAYVAGSTGSSDFPVTHGAFQKTKKTAIGTNTLFIAKLNPTATALDYATYLGGSGNPLYGNYAGDLINSGKSIAVDASGDAYVAGITYSSDFPVTQGVLQSTLPSPPPYQRAVDGFVSKLNPAGSGLVYSTYLGEASYAQVSALAVDASGNAYVTGSASAGFPTSPGAFEETQPVQSGEAQGGVFVAKLNPQASALIYSTYLGGSYDNGDDSASGIAVDGLGDAYVTGTTAAPDFPVTGDAFQPIPAGYSAEFLSKLNPTGSGLLYSTYFGLEIVTNYGTVFLPSVAVDSSGNAYLAGATQATNFPITNGAFRTTAPPAAPDNPGFLLSAFVSKFSFAPGTLTPTTTVVTSSANPIQAQEPLTFTAGVTATAGGGTPTGSVNFLLGTTGLINLYSERQVTVPLDGTGHATLSFSSSSPEVALEGSVPVGVAYSGDSTYAPSSGSLLQTLQPGPLTFSVPSGTSSATPLLVSITAPGAYGIYYTTDGSIPGSNYNTTLVYGGPILVTSTEKIQAYAFLYFSNSPTVAATYTITSPTPAGTIDFADGFTQSTGPQLVGAASKAPPELLLGPGNSAFYYPQSVPVQAFTTDFTFQLTSTTSIEPLNSIADGFTFVIQNSGLSALGSTGSGLGYAGIAKSVAVKFDLHSNAGEGPNSTGLYIDGAKPTVPAIDLTGTGINLHSGDLFAAHVTYDGATLVLTITDTTTNASYTHSFPIDIPGTVGGTTAYVGFTGSFANYVNPAILSWTYVPGPPNFSTGFGGGTLGMVENGNAKVSGTALELTDGGLFETSAAFYSTPVNMQSFTTNFQFQLSGCCVDTPPYLADGITFTIQNAGTTALGAKGGGLGYAGIGKSLAIKFDLHSDAGEGDNSTGLYIDGAAPTVPALNLNGNNSGINLQNGHIFDANLAYDGTNLALTITDTVTKKAYTHSFAIDIPATVGGNTAYVGFTGATGALTATQEILNWTFTNP